MAVSQEELEKQITALWEGRDDLFAVLPEADARAAVHQAIELLDTGEARVAELVDDDVVVHEWLKYAVLLLFRLSQMETTELGPVRVRRQDPAQARLPAPGRARRARARRRAGARTSRPAR